MAEYFIVGLGGLALLPIVFRSTATTLFVAFTLMCNVFDLVPNKIAGVEIWDLGVVILFAGLLRFSLRGLFDLSGERAYIKAIGWYLIFLIVVFLLSITYQGYSVIEAVQASRQMILGYLSFFALRRYAFIDKEAVLRVFSLLYPLMYCLLILYILQYLTHYQLFHGYHREFEGAVRSIPIFLPLAYVFYWFNLAKFFSGESMRGREIIYVALTSFATLITYTRGIYFTVFITAMILLAMLFRSGRLSVKKALAFLIVLLCALPISLSNGSFGRYLERAGSGVSELSGAGASADDEGNFSFRMLLLAERARMVAETNPAIGFGFMHENVAQRQLKYAFGTVTDDGEKAFHTPDIAWANIIICSGFPGLALFLFFVYLFLRNFRAHPESDPSFRCLRLSLFLQIVSMIILMFNSPNFTTHLQIPMFLLVIYGLVTAPANAKFSRNLCQPVPKYP